jgi:hypothetical protein
VSVESHRRLIGGLRQSVDKASGKTDGWNLKEAILEGERRAQAVRTFVTFALQLAGTDKLPPPLVAPVGLGNAPLHVPEPPPRVRRPAESRVWTKDVRPGPHDVLTWEEAMQVPWFDPFAETER